MKKTGLFLLLLWAVAALRPERFRGRRTPQGTVLTRRVSPSSGSRRPTNADLYCAGFVNKQLMPNANFVAGGLQTPNTTKFVNGDMIYLAGSGYQAGQQYTILRELRDPNQLRSLRRTAQHD